MPEALPVSGVETPGRGLLRVVTPAELVQRDTALAAQKSADQQAPEMDQLASHVRSRLTEMRNFRNTEKISERLIEALRTYKGMYSAQKLTEIKQFGGSEVYARVTATKCRGATALLRDVFLGPERPWDLCPTPVPTLPEDVMKSVDELVNVEISTLQQAGMPVDPQMISDRVEGLRKAAAKAAEKQAREEADKATKKLDDVLTEGDFYTAFAEFLIDLPIFPYACIKGPVVRKVSTLKWVNGTPQMQSVPRMFWYRVSPFDLYFSPGASNRHEAEFVERIRLTRADLIAVKGLPGYRDDMIDRVLDEYSDKGFREWWDVTDAERAALEDRERWPHTSTGLIDTAEYHGSVSGKTLLEWGVPEDQVQDPLGEYKVVCWLVNRYVIKAQINPSPRQSVPYYITSFEKVPGGIVGNGLPDILDDIQQVSNATLRALVNNLSIASGPQVVINDEVTTPGETDDLYPWKRWHVRYDPMVTGSSAQPVTFFQPNSFAAELLGVFKEFSGMADEVSAIPRYMMGSEKVGGAGRTASGLAMLMGNAAKTLQNVAATIDREVMLPMLEDLYDMLMLTTENILRGDEQIVVKGVNFAVKREQDRMRQLEFLQITANPLDMQIIGPMGRANVLRSVAGNLGLDHERVVPTDEELRGAMQAPMGPNGGVPGAPTAQQQPAPQDDKAGPEQTRKEQGTQQMFASNGQAGGGTPTGG